MKALIVDDDLALVDVIDFTLRRAGFSTVFAHDGDTALSRWESEAPDIIILDWNLPKLNGLEVCRRIRSQSDTPIIILSVRSAEDDVVKGLELGADDYIVKPFSPRQLVARAEALLRRAKVSHHSTAEPVSAGRLALDPSRSQVVVNDGLPIKLAKLESRLLEILMLNHGLVLSVDTLIDHIWGPAGGDRAMVKQLVYRIRKKIESDPANPQFIETVGGVGYSLKKDI
jgi:DNA-binding response OmpR family regulator